MSKHLTLSTLFAAFGGSKEARILTVHVALTDALQCYLQHGTDAPIVEAMQTVATMRDSQPARALREGVKAAGLKLVEVKGKRATITCTHGEPGKMPALKDDGTVAPKGTVSIPASEAAAEAGMLFLTAVQAVMDEQTAKAADPSKAIAKALGVLAKATPAQVRKLVIGSADWSALLSIVTKVQAEEAAAKAAEVTERARRVPKVAAPLDDMIGQLKAAFDSAGIPESTEQPALAE